MNGSRSLAEFSGDGYDRGRGLHFQILWLLLQDLLIVKWWCPNRVRILLLRALGAKIGQDVVIRHRVRIHWPWKLEIGDSSWIGEDVWILNLEPVRIGRDTCISQSVLLCSGSHDRESPTFEFDNAPIEVGDRVWVAARATVLRGVKIGDGSTVGATALVTRDVAPSSVVLSPANEVRG